MPKTPKRSWIFPVRSSLSWVYSLIFLLACLQVVHASDPYAAALDSRFSTDTAALETHHSRIADLEAGIKDQARERSQRPELSPPPNPAAGFEQCLLWALGAVGALGVGLVSLIALRQWNHFLDRPRPGLTGLECVMATDPAMAEFLRTLHEEPLIASGAANGNTSAQSSVWGSTGNNPDPAARNPAEPGRDSVRGHLAVLRTEFPKLGRSLDDAERLRILHKLLEQVELVQESSCSPELRPLRLLACAMRGFLNQLSGKAANITPSALRTLAAAFDLLELLCTRSFRADLATHPPIRLLAVDDDPISRRAVDIALRRSFPGPQLAIDGHSALAFAAQQRYDAVFLDVEMPGMDGFELCSKIRESVPNRATPVIFVTSHGDFDSRAKSALLGAHDLISKPFLGFDITIKTLTLVLTARLQAEDAKPAPSDSQEPAAAASVPVVADAPAVSAVVQLTLPDTRSSPPGCLANQLVAERGSRLDASITPPPVAAPDAQPKPGNDTLPHQPRPSNDESDKVFIKNAPARLQLLRQRLASASAAAQPADRDKLLGELFVDVHTLCSGVGRTQLSVVSKIGSALESLLKKLIQRPNFCTPSALNTAALALNTIDQLCHTGRNLDLARAPIRLLVVDDDPVARRAVGGALQLAFGRPDNADCGEAALNLASNNPYDLIFLDIIMPGMDGLVVCTKLRELALNRETPVVFVTSQDDANSLSKAAASGGCGFIPKPVLPCEIMLLALTLIVRSRLDRHNREHPDLTKN